MDDDIRISIHTLLAESDNTCHFKNVSHSHHFNPHSPRREWLKDKIGELIDIAISIHTLLAESDFTEVIEQSAYHYFNPHSPRREWPQPVIIHPAASKFQSTLSSQRVTIFWTCSFNEYRISIHTLLAESDACICVMANTFYISIHTLLAESDEEFNNGEYDYPISIHTLLAESDENKNG